MYNHTHTDQGSTLREHCLTPSGFVYDLHLSMCFLNILWPSTHSLSNCQTLTFHQHEGNMTHHHRRGRRWNVFRISCFMFLNTAVHMVTVIIPVVYCKLDTSHPFHTRQPCVCCHFICDFSCVICICPVCVWILELPQHEHISSLLNS